MTKYSFSGWVKKKIGEIDSIDEGKGIYNILSVDEDDGDYNLHMFVPLRNVRLID